MGFGFRIVCMLLATPAVWNKATRWIVFKGLKGMEWGPDRCWCLCWAFLICALHVLCFLYLPLPLYTPKRNQSVLLKCNLVCLCVKIDTWHLSSSVTVGYSIFSQIIKQSDYVQQILFCLTITVIMKNSCWNIIRYIFTHFTKRPHKDFKILNLLII